MIGAGIFQSYGIKVAKKMNLKVCVIDKDEHAPGIPFADDFIRASTRHIEEALPAAEEFHKRYKLDGVFTCGTDVSHTVACIAKALNLRGIPPETALLATDKGKMREALKKKGVPVPSFHVVNSLSEAKEAAADIGFPLVIKPVDNMGARGVKKIVSLADLVNTFPLALNFSSKGLVILETYISGPEISIDTLVEKPGHVHLITIADRIIAMPPYFVEKGHTIPSIHPKEKLHSAFDMAKRGVEALGITLGAAKYDMKLSPKGPVIGEMAARLSGGFHSGVTEPLATGMNSIKAAIDLCLGNPLDLKDISPRFHYAAAERSLYPKPGRVISISGVDKARSLKNIELVHLNVKEGGTLNPLTSNIGKAGHVVGWGKTRSEAVKNTLNAVRTIRIKTDELR